MNLAKLEKAQKLYNRVKELDSEIIEIEKVALLISSKKSEINFSLKVTDLEKVKESDKVKIDDDGSLVHGERIKPFRFYFSLDPKPTQSEKKEYDAKVKHSVSDSVALKLLNILLQDKMEARELAIKALNKIGIEA